MPAVYYTRRNGGKYNTTKKRLVSLNVVKMLENLACVPESTVTMEQRVGFFLTASSKVSNTGLEYPIYNPLMSMV